MSNRLGSRDTRSIQRPASSAMAALPIAASVNGHAQSIIAIIEDAVRRPPTDRPITARL